MEIVCSRADITARNIFSLQKYLFLCLGCLLVVAAAASAQAKLNVFVSILPQEYFVERVGGEHVVVSVLVGPGQSPHAYEPTPRQVAALSGADIFFKIGLPFEARLLGKINQLEQGGAVVDTREGIALRPSEGGDEHAGADPHIWLAPKLICRQAATICRALQAKDAVHAAAYQQNLENFSRELEELDGELAQLLKPCAGRQILVFHPAFGYFTDAYGIKQAAIEMEGKEPGSKSLGFLLMWAKTAGVKTIFAERQFSPKSAQAVAAQIGAGVVMLDPLAPDCLQNLRAIAAALAASCTQ